MRSDRKSLLQHPTAKSFPVDLPFLAVVPLSKEFCGDIGLRWRSNVRSNTLLLPSMIEAVGSLLFEATSAVNMSVKIGWITWDWKITFWAGLRHARE